MYLFLEKGLKANWDSKNARTVISRFRDDDAGLKVFELSSHVSRVSRNYKKKKNRPRKK